MLKQISFKTPDEAAQLFDRLYAIALEKSPTLTKGSYFEEVINGYANPKTQTVNVDNPELLAKITDLENQIELLNEETTNYLEESKKEVVFFNHLLTALNLTENASYVEIIAEIKATQNRAIMAFSTPEPAANQIMFTIDQPHLALLQETVKRLSEQYGTTVTMKDVLMDMFARYTIEQFNEWFYPFVINGDADFKAITGYTQKELKQWLKTK
jgi:hypothetical protein